MAKPPHPATMAPDAITTATLVSNRNRRPIAAVLFEIDDGQCTVVNRHVIAVRVRAQVEGVLLTWTYRDDTRDGHDRAGRARDVIDLRIQKRVAIDLNISDNVAIDERPFEAELSYQQDLVRGSARNGKFCGGDDRIDRGCHKDGIGIAVECGVGHDRTPSYVDNLVAFHG